MNSMYTGAYMVGAYHHACPLGHIETTPVATVRSIAVLDVTCPMISCALVSAFSKYGLQSCSPK